MSPFASSISCKFVIIFNGVYKTAIAFLFTTFYKISLNTPRSWTSLAICPKADNKWSIVSLPVGAAVKTKEILSD